MTQNLKKQDPRDAYLALGILMGNDGYYFYQDWDADFETEEEILQAFYEIESPELRRQTIKDIDQLLRDYHQEDEHAMEIEIEEVLSTLSNAYDYYYDGYDSISWLRHLQEEIQKSLE